MKHLKIYRAIRLIHRTGSIRKAAIELAISPSALNRSIQSFEDELGFSVFERLPGGVRLSDAGEILLDLIDRHLVEFGELQRQLGNLRDGDVGELRISIGADIAAGLVLRCITEMEQQYPGISVEIIYDNTAESLRERRVQLALLTNPVTDDATEVVHASECRLAAWQSGHPMHRPSGVWDLAGLRVLLPVEATGSRTSISHFLRRNRMSLASTSAVPAAQIGQHLRGTEAVAIFPEIAVNPDDLPSGGTKLPFDIGTVQCCALRKSGVPLTRPAQAYLSILQRQLEGA